MVGQMLKGLITDPGSAIAAGKREGSMKKTGILLVINWVVAAVSVLIAGVSVPATVFGPFSTIVGYVGIAAVMMAIGGILLTAFIALLMQLTVNALGGKGKYLDGLSTLTYATWPLALGSLIASILVLGGMPGVFIGTLALAILGILSAAIAFRSVKEMFGTDYITALIALGIIGIGMSVAATAATGAAAAPLALRFVNMLAPLAGGMTLPVV